MKVDKFNNFILERRIAQISSQIEITFGFDIIKTKHSDERSDLTQRSLGYNIVQLPNKTITEFVESFKLEISEAIAVGKLVDQTKFVIRNSKRNLSMVILAEEVTSKYWKLIVITIFPESEDEKLRIGYNQLVFDK